MREFQLIALCLCLALTSSELVGPDALKETEENEQENEEFEEREEAERMIIKKAIEDERNKFDPETLKDLEAAISKELEDAVNKEILTYKEYVETLKTTKELMQGEDTNKSKINTCFPQRLTLILVMLFYLL